MQAGSAHAVPAEVSGAGPAFLTWFKPAEVKGRVSVCVLLMLFSEVGPQAPHVVLRGPMGLDSDPPTASNRVSRVDFQSGQTPKIHAPRVDFQTGQTPKIHVPRVDFQSGQTPNIHVPHVDFRNEDRTPTRCLRDIT